MDASPTSLPRTNNFDAMRLLAAFAVIAGHAPLLLGVGTPLRVLGVPVHSLGVYVFFSMSGYLIATSWMRGPSLPGYLRNRVLRIFPGLALVTVVTILVLGPLFTTLDLSTYFGAHGTWNYLRNIALRPVFHLPGVFADLPYPSSVNGSLWTLPVEFACYVAVPLLLVVPARFRTLTIGAFAILAIAADRLLPGAAVIYGTSITQGATLVVFFGIGTILAVNARRIPLRLDAALLLLTFQVVFALAVPAEISRVSLWVVLPYVVLTICTQSTPVIRRAARFGDASYGLYIYAFPVQQIVRSVLGPIPIVLDLLVVVIVTTALAFGSWHLLEKRAMRLKWSNSRSLPDPSEHPDLSVGAVPRR